MAGGVKVGSAYVDLTVKADGSTGQQVVNSLKEIDRVAQTTMAGLRTNFEQTWSTLSSSSKQAYSKLTSDAQQYKSELEKINKIQAELGDKTKFGNRSGAWSPFDTTLIKAHADETKRELTQIQTLRTEAQKTYAQMGQDQKAFVQTLTQSGESAWGGFKTAFHRAMTSTSAEQKTWGQSMAHDLAVPFQRAGDAIASVFKGVFDKIATMAKYAFLGVAGTITAALSVGVYKGLQQLSDVEQLRTKMKFLGQDMMQFNTMLRDMEGLEKVTGFDMVDLANAALAFLQQGVKSGTDLNRVMQDAADISAATGQSIQETSMQVIRFMSGNTQRMQQQIMAMANKQIPIYKWFAEELGVTQQEVYKMLSKGQIAWEVYERVVQKHLHGISQAMGNTFKGAIARVKDSIEDLAAAVMRPFFGPMTSGMNQISTWIDKLTEKVKANQPAIVHTAGVIAQAFIQAGKGVLELFSTLSRAMSSSLSAAADVAAALGQSQLAQDLRAAAQSIENNVTVPMKKAAIEADRLKESTKGFFDQLEQRSVLTSAFNDSITNATDEGVFVKDPTEAVRQNLTQLKIDLQTMPDGTFKLVPLTPDAAKLVDDYQRQLGLKPLYLDMEARVKKIDWMGREKFNWTTTGPNPGQTAVPLDSAVQPQNFSDGNNAMTLPPWLIAGTNLPAGAVAAGKWVAGNVFGRWESGKYPTEATIQPAVGPYGLVQWAEPSTGGEAFIPLAASNRERSLDIWEQTGRLLGVFDRGGFKETTSDPSLWWWKWLGKRKAWIHQNNELVRPPLPMMPGKADRKAQEETLTGKYDQTLPGHITAPWTTQFSPSAGDYAPPGPGQVNPNYRIDTSNATYLPGPGIAWDSNPASSWVQGDVPLIDQMYPGVSMNPAWHMWWESQLRSGPSPDGSGWVEPFKWGARPMRELPAFNSKDRHNPITEAAGPWWGFTIPKFAGGGWLGGSKGGGGRGGWSGGGRGGYSGVGGIRLWAGEIQRLIHQLFPQIHQIGGYRAWDPYPDHPSGEAVDVMIPGWNTKPGVALGNRIKDFAMRNARPLHVDYAIWRQAMWYPGRAPQGMGDRGSPTQNHYDHVHIRVQRGGGGPDIPGMMPGGRISLGGAAGYPGMGMRISGSYVPIGYPQLPAGRWRTRSFAGGGFRWPWKRDGQDQIGPFPVIPEVAAAAKPRGGIGTAGKAPVPGTGGGTSGFRPPYQHVSEPPQPPWQDPGTGTVLPSGGGSMTPDDSGSSSDSSSDSGDGSSSPYYTPGGMTLPDDMYFNSDDFMTDPEITPAEARKLRNLQNKVEDLNGKLNVANQQLAELKSNPKTKPSQILSKEKEIQRLTADRDNAVDDLNKAQQEVLIAKPGRRGRGDGTGINSALADNPYYKLMQAEKMKQEAYASIMPDPGALADIGIGGLKESFLPPGFSDPTGWGVTQAASGLLNFLGGIMPDPISRGLLSMGGAALSGSGSGMASAIRGMIPQPFGSLEIGSPDEAPGIPGYDMSGMPVPGRHLPVGQVPGAPRVPGPANTAGVYNDNRIQVQGDSQTAVTDNTVRTLQKRDAANARRNIGKYARGST